MRLTNVYLFAFVTSSILMHYESFLSVMWCFKKIDRRWIGSGSVKTFYGFENNVFLSPFFIFFTLDDIDRKKGEECCGSGPVLTGSSLSAQTRPDPYPDLDPP
jgi:hypothetical protein